MVNESMNDGKVEKVRQRRSRCFGELNVHTCTPRSPRCLRPYWTRIFEHSQFPGIMYRIGSIYLILGTFGNIQQLLDSHLDSQKL